MITESKKFNFIFLLNKNCLKTKTEAIFVLNIFSKKLEDIKKVSIPRQCINPGNTNDCVMTV